MQSNFQKYLEEFDTLPMHEQIAFGNCADDDEVISFWHSKYTPFDEEKFNEQITQNEKFKLRWA